MNDESNQLFGFRLATDIKATNVLHGHYDHKTALWANGNGGPLAMAGPVDSTDSYYNTVNTWSTSNEDGSVSSDSAGGMDYSTDQDYPNGSDDGIGGGGNGGSINDMFDDIGFWAQYDHC
jgi:hypothetical protein